MRRDRFYPTKAAARHGFETPYLVGICLVLCALGCGPAGLIEAGGKEEEGSATVLPSAKTSQSEPGVICPADQNCTSLAQVIACANADIPEIDLRKCADLWSISGSLKCEIPSRVGDLNGDRQVDQNDLVAFSLVMEGYLNPPSNICCIDVNGDQKINIMDAASIALFSTRQCFSRGYSCGLRENCADAKDNDCDGLVDTADPDCPTECPVDLKCITLAQMVSCRKAGKSDAELQSCAAHWETLNDLECKADALVGDLDGDGSVTNRDMMILTFVTNGFLNPPANTCCIDVNGDQRINVLDATWMGLFSSRHCFPRGFSCRHVENCVDGRDNDCDGLADNVDPDCQSAPVKNEKDMTRYTNKQAFLISDDNWRAVLSLVPAVVWTTEDQASACNRGYGTPANVCVYPTLIYRIEKETTAIDADSIIRFLQQYQPGSVTILDDSVEELDDLLAAQPPNGVGLSPEQIQLVQAAGHFTGYWKSYRDVVYVEDDYAKALMASVYASFVNAPLIIKGYNDDIALQDVNVICVGSPSSICRETVTTEELESRYSSLTKTNRLVLVNPNDLTIHEAEVFTPEKSASAIAKIYTKASLTAPFLAASKHEIIVGTTATGYAEVDSFLEGKQISLGADHGYLTVVAAPNAIPMSRDDGDDIDYSCYSRLGGCDFLLTTQKGSVAVGRIFGITASDVSSYVARALWYDQIGSAEQFENVLSYCKHEGFCGGVESIRDAFADVGYNAVYSEQPLSEDLRNKGIIYYSSHGTTDWAGVHSSEIPDLSSSLMVMSACLTCAFYNSSGDPTQPKSTLFCAQALRKGAIGYIGSVEVAFSIPVWRSLFGRLLSLKEGTIGEKIDLNSNTVFLGDPTLVLKVPHKINHVDPWVDELSDDGNKVTYRINLTGGVFNGLTLTLPEPFLGNSIGGSYFPMPVEVPRKDTFVVGTFPFSQTADKTIATLGPYQCPNATFSDCSIDFGLYRFAPDFRAIDVSLVASDDTSIEFEVVVNNNGNLAGLVEMTLIDAVDVNKSGVGDCTTVDVTDIVNAVRNGRVQTKELVVGPQSNETIRVTLRYLAGERCLRLATKSTGAIPEINSGDNWLAEYASF